MGCQQFTNPIAFRPFEYRFAFSIQQAGTNALLQKFLDDLVLRGPGVLSAGTTAAGVLHRQMERGGARFVPDGGLTSRGQ
ncbi:MAG: hypothetical protein K0Q55_507 [Verrucomicrobia bacterium]|nr:hypothetical protein [Verrucomicrobiota bacterium]